MLEKKTEDVKPVEGDGTVSPPVETPESVASQEVKPEPQFKEADNKSVDAIAKQQKQIDNLHIALKQERDSKKTNQEKVDSLESRLQESQDTINRLKNVFSPEEKQPETPSEFTREEAEALWEEKDKERQEAEKTSQRESMIKSEIVDLSKEYDGTDGKPKYVDEEVLKWQQANDRLYLSPKEAFSQMKNKEIIDYQVKQRMAGSKPSQTVEQPAPSPGTHEPPEKKIQTDKDLRAAALEAMETADVEL